METGLKGRIVILLLAATLIAGAVVARVWLAATGGYSEGNLALPLRVGSTVALFGGFLLAALAVAWPMRKARGGIRDTEETKTGNGR